MRERHRAEGGIGVEFCVEGSVRLYVDRSWCWDEN